MVEHRMNEKVSMKKEKGVSHHETTGILGDASPEQHKLSFADEKGQSETVGYLPPCTYSFCPCYEIVPWFSRFITKVGLLSSGEKKILTEFPC